MRILYYLKVIKYFLYESGIIKKNHHTKGFFIIHFNNKTWRRYKAFVASTSRRVNSPSDDRALKSNQLLN